MVMLVAYRKPDKAKDIQKRKVAALGHPMQAIKKCVAWWYFAGR